MIETSLDVTKGAWRTFWSSPTSMISRNVESKSIQNLASITKDFHSALMISLHLGNKWLYVDCCLWVKSWRVLVNKLTTCPRPLHQPHVLPYNHQALLFCRKLISKNQKQIKEIFFKYSCTAFLKRLCLCLALLALCRSSYSIWYNPKVHKL